MKGSAQGGGLFQGPGGSITAAAFRIVVYSTTGSNPFDLSHVFVRRSDLNNLSLLRTAAWQQTPGHEQR